MVHAVTTDTNDLYPANLRITIKSIPDTKHISYWTLPTSILLQDVLLLDCIKYII